MSSLPLDLHIAILGFLPPSRCRLSEDVAVRTLVNYSQTNSLLWEAASLPVVWKPHYRTRYCHCCPSTENLRKFRYEGNWRLMYYERYRTDRVALELLRDITLLRVGRGERAVMLSKIGLDVWDVLDIELKHVPAIRALPDTEPPYALTRHFWTRRMLDVIAREEAIEVWGTLLGNADVPMEKRASFEQTMLGLSAFFGESLSETTRLLDDMEAECRKCVQKKGLTLDDKSPDYSVPELCKAICGFMVGKGFGPSLNNMFFDVLNHFPHTYLTTNKRTLPIALIHVFVSLARRLGLDASPVNFPEKVLCNVRSPRGDGPYHINAFVEDAEKCIIKIQDLGLHLSDPRLLDSISQTYLSRYLDPADPSTMLLRAARNILVSYSHAPTLSYDVRQRCLYLAVVVHLMFHGDIEVIARILRAVDLRDVDCTTFLLDKLAPILPTPTKRLLETHCKIILDHEAVDATRVQTRHDSPPVQYCVGLPFRHRRYGYIACIVRWDAMCMAGDLWMDQMGVDNLDRGRHQPFYTSLVLDEGATQRYIAEENIEPIPLPEGYIEEFFEKHPNMAMYFQSVEMEETSELTNKKRWRFVLSPESRASYPEDDTIGSSWVKEGTLPEVTA
ncbi:hypothetical protein P691DRAFT_657002 [Macrolepiota fuliginosa MF-IS2]|uniref:Hemimethylated DNA-binding domain-containing protein n=1 Tax=Macrolepiota fuliginosa MF-IS2 TaxID=1400762 RepID=A0A9P5XNL3_9AGAR|nr:hypothetical protein P691DRAFT_657002 [Macrolepiota fuliginosa MF-IS2]